MAKKQSGTVAVAAVGTSDLLFALPEGTGARWCPLGGLRSNRDDRLRIAEHIGAGDVTLRALSRTIADKLDDDEVRARLAMPILKPALDWIIQDCYSIGRVSLIVTDQQPAHDDDTVDIGRILARLISDQYPDRVAVIDPAFITIRANANQYDHVYEVLRRELRAALPREGVGALYVVQAGSIPAIRDALRQHVFNTYRGKAKVIKVAERDGSASELSPDPYMRDIIRQTAEDLVRFHQYGAALQVLEGAPRHQWPQTAMALLQVGADRVNLDFKSAAGRELPAEVRERVGSDTHTPLSFLAEVRFLIEQLLTQRRYADALYRLGLFWEIAVWLYACSRLELEDERSDGALRIPLAALQAKDPLLLDALKNQCEVDRGSVIVRERTAYAALLSRLTGNTDAERSAQAQLNLGLFEKLRTLRNRTVHQGRGVSEADIEAAGGVGELRGALERVMKALCEMRNVDVPASRYKALNEAIARTLAAD